MREDPGKRIEAEAVEARAARAQPGKREPAYGTALVVEAIVFGISGRRKGKGRTRSNENETRGIDASRAKKVGRYSRTQAARLSLTFVTFELVS